MEIKPSIRHVKEMQEVLLSKDLNPEEELYYMFRGVGNKNKIRYDITEIPGKILGDEFVKTKGHYHDEFKEVYIVLEGEAIFLMQKGRDVIDDVYFVHASKDEVVVIPFGYGHITINPSEVTLKLGNFVSDECGHDYESIGNKAGASYFYTTKGWLKNTNYKEVPEIREEKPLTKLPNNIDELCLKIAQN